MGCHPSPRSWGNAEGLVSPGSSLPSRVDTGQLWPALLTITKQYCFIAASPKFRATMGSFPPHSLNLSTFPPGGKRESHRLAFSFFSQAERLMTGNFRSARDNERSEPMLSTMALTLACLSFAEQLQSEAAGPAIRGTVEFRPRGDQQAIPSRYRLSARKFDFSMTLVKELPNTGIEIYQLRYPSPVVSPTPENNTVYAEYYRPKEAGRYPGVIVLDITAGDQSLSRMIARCLAQKGVAALFVQMAYYGPRRPANSPVRLLSTNIPQTFEAIRQTVLDVRLAAAWLASRSEIDPARIGLHGTSLGSMVGALAAEMEPRIRRVSILLGGGGLVDAYYDHPLAAPYRRIWEALGGSKRQVGELLAPVDPITCAANLRDRRVLFTAGKRDEIVPPSATVALARAIGEPHVVWFDCSHYGAALYFVPILNLVAQHFKE
jgi:dienelactone hydrolase